MPSMLTFLQTGRLGPVSVDKPISTVFDLLGDPPVTGVRLTRPWQMAVYAGHALQISYIGQSIGLIGLYFLHPKRVPKLPACLGVDVPFTGSTTSAQLIEFLDRNNVPWIRDERLPGSEGLLLAKSVHVVFEEGRLRSVLAKASEDADVWK